MGCGASKLDEEKEALVKLCRERKELLRSATDHRFALAAAHVAYFCQLKDVGETLWRFVEEELVLISSSSSPSSPSSLSSPHVFALPNDFKLGGGKGGKKKRGGDAAGGGGGDGSNHSHLHWSSSSGSGDTGHLDIDDDDDDESTEEIHHHHDHPKNNHDHGGHEFRERPVKEKNRGVGVGGEGDLSPQPGISYIPDPNPNPGSYYSYGDPYNNNNPGYGYGYPQQGSYYAENYGPSSNNNNGYNFDYPSNYNYNDGSGSGIYGYGSGNGTTSYGAYYMKKSSTRIPTVIYEEPKGVVHSTIHSYSNSPNNYVNGYVNVSGGGVDRPQQRRREEEVVRPPTPPPANVSAWDYFNPFESYETHAGVGIEIGVGGGYFGNSVQQPGNGMYGYGNGGGYESSTSTPDSREVREREGIPELEEETETEVSFPAVTKKAVPPKGSRSVHFHDQVYDIPPAGRGRGKGNGNGKSKGKKSAHNGNVDGFPRFEEGSSKKVPFVAPEPELEPVDEAKQVDDSTYSPDTDPSVVTLSTSGEHEVQEEEEHEHQHEHEHEHGFVYDKKKGVRFELDSGGGGSSHDIQSSSKPSSLTTLSAHGTRDLREVVREIKDEFEAATDYGKEVSVLLEVGKEPYRSRTTLLRVMLAKVCSTSLSSTHDPSSLSTGIAEEDLDSRSLASTLDKLYVWEKKLYKEVKEEEKLRLMYEKQCKKLKTLDELGAEDSKIEATQASIRKLLTRINVSVRAVDGISTRIHKLRDEELQPQLKELIYGLKKMWKLMLKCHQKQFQAILESKTRALKAKTGLRKDSSVRATIQLEAQLLKWCQRFNNWIEMQRSYVDTLNDWLERCIHYEPIVTTDGVMPFSPGKLGAPPVFVICHDWKQAMERVSESEVQTAMNDFATSLHQLWERQDEEQRRRLKAENMYKDFEKRIRAIRVDKQRKGQEHDETFSDKNSLSIVASESGISPLDDLKVDLDSMRQRVREERAGHKEAVKLVHDAVSRTIQSGLIPIFEALESFTSGASKALDDVRLEYVVGNA